MVVALRRVPPVQSYLPSGAFTDGERLALPLWLASEQSPKPMWFLLDTVMRRTALTKTAARHLGVVQDEVVRGLCFANEPLDDLPVQIIPDGAAVLGPKEAEVQGILGADFLHSWDLDLDLPRGLCRAWPAGDELPRGFSLPDAVEIPLQGHQGLLEVKARLRGTVCNGQSETSGPSLKAVVDLGQTYSACNWAAAAQVGISGAGDPCVRKAGQWLDLDGNQMDVYEAEMGVELPGRVGGVLQGVRLCTERLFWLADTLPLLERLGFNPSEPMAVLGLDTVGRVRLSVSARHRRLWLPM